MAGALPGTGAALPRRGGVVAAGAFGIFGGAREWQKMNANGKQALRGRCGGQCKPKGRQVFRVQFSTTSGSGRAGKQHSWGITLWNSVFIRVDSRHSRAEMFLWVGPALPRKWDGSAIHPYTGAFVWRCRADGEFGSAYAAFADSGGTAFALAALRAKAGGEGSRRLLLCYKNQRFANGVDFS